MIVESLKKELIIMKKEYSAPATDIVLLGTAQNMMDEAPVNPYSDTTGSYDSNTATMDIEEDEFTLEQKSLWD